MNSQKILFAKNGPYILDTANVDKKNMDDSQINKKKIDITKKFMFMLLKTTSVSLKTERKNSLTSCFKELKPLIHDDFVYRGITTINGYKGLALLCRHMRDLKRLFLL